MASDGNVGNLSYSLDMDTSKLIASQRKAERELNKTAKSFDGLGGSIRDADKQLGDFAKNINPMNLAIAGLSAGIAAAGVASAMAADNFRLLGSRVEIAAGSVALGADAMTQIIEIARNTRNGVEETAQVFTRLNQSIIQMGGSQYDTLKLTELLGKAIKTSGANAQEASAAMLQFGQALGSGKLQGDELRSLMETAPYLMRQLAEGIGVPVGALKKLGEEGKLTSDVVVNAMGKAANQIGEDFEKMGLSLSDSMTLSKDAAIRLNEQIDEQSGLSAALTGIVKGLADAFDGLLVPIDETSKASNKLQRERAIAGWAQESTEFMATMADAADVVWQTISVLGRNVAFVFKGIGSEIGGIGAQVAAVMDGDFKRAAEIGDMMKADAAQRRKDLDSADAKTLADRESWGDRIRRQHKKTSSFTSGEFSKLNAPMAEDNKKKTAKKGKTEEQKAAEEWEKWKDKQRAEDIVSARKYREEQAELADQEVREQLKREEEKARVQYEVSQQIGGITALDAEFALKADKLNEYLNAELITQETHDLAMIALAQETSDKVANITKNRTAEQIQSQYDLLGAYSQVFDGMAGLAETFGDKQSGAYKAMFAVSKAFSIAQAGIAIQTGLANAFTLPFPANLAEYAKVASLGAGIMGNIKGLNFGGGRQYGGGVSSSSFYRGGEAGPEMLMGNSGKNYFIPPENGKVVPTNQLMGGGSAPQINIHNYAGADISSTASSDGRIIDIAVNRAVAEVAGQFQTNSGKVWNAAKAGSNIQGRTV